VANFKTGAVVLIHFPFTDGSSAKKRPALVLLDAGDNDLLLARITTQFSAMVQFGKSRTTEARRHRE